MLRQLYRDIESSVCVLASQELAHQPFLDAIDGATAFLNCRPQFTCSLDAYRCVRALRATISRCQPDLVHTYLWSSDIHSILALRGMDIGHVAHIVDRRADRHTKRIRTRLKVAGSSHLYRNCRTRFVAVSEACRQHAIEHYRIPSSRIVVAHNGICVHDFDVGLDINRSQMRGKPVVVGTMSCFREEKGHRYLLLALRELRQLAGAVVLRIAGSGRTSDAVDEYRQMAKDFGVDHMVEFIGRADSARDFYAGIDVFVVPSISSEGLPTTILEAMAARLPVLATDVGGAVEAVRDGIDGLIVPARDPAALARGIEKLMHAPDRTSMGEAGHDRVARFFSLEQMTRTIVEDVYRPVLANGGRGR